MQKRGEDSVERSKYDTFMTSHGKILNDITSRTLNCINYLKSIEVKVWRYKIEETIIDSRIKDEFNLLEIK